MCRACGEVKPISAFAWQKNRPSPRRTCKVCRYASRDHEKERKRHRDYMRERRKAEPDVVRENWERCKYGVAKSDFGYRECWICGSTKRLHIDHNHATGSPRGLLCHGCNVGIGHFVDDPGRLARAIEYLLGAPHISGKDLR